MMALALTAWRILTSRAGLAALGVGLALAVLYGWGEARYDAGKQAGKAQVQAEIDAPVTGWVARLDQCNANLRVKSQAIDGQNETIRIAAERSADALRRADEAVAASRAQATRDAKTIAALMRPLAASDSCARVQEMDRRLLESINAR